MRILAVTTRFPFPVVGGDRLRFFKICEGLSKYHDLDLISLTDNPRTPIESSHFETFNVIETIYLSRFRSFWNCLRGLFKYLPLQVMYYHSDQLRNRLRHASNDYDCVFLHLVRLGEYIGCINAPIWLEMTDAISLNYSRVIATKKTLALRGLIYAFEYKRLVKYEQAIIRKVNGISLISEVDRCWLERTKPFENMAVVSNGVNLLANEFKERSIQNNNIVFIGNMLSYQNLDACLYFANEVLPVICERARRDIKFRIIGQISRSDSMRLSRIKNVEVFGKFDAIEDALVGSFAGVCPVRLGAGLQNKILEYMALGLPTVSTSVGLEGLKAKKGRDLLVADDPEIFAQYVLDILSDRELAREYSKNGRRYVERHHDWDTEIRLLSDRIEKLCL